MTIVKVKFSRIFIMMFYLFLFNAVIVSGCKEEIPDELHEIINRSDPPAESPPSGETRLRTIYVPAYSHLPNGNKNERELFFILLSVRNMDSTTAITLTHVNYFDTSGHKVRQYIKEPIKLRPLETVEFKVDTVDDIGGSGANFLVYWEGPSDAHSLLAESIMWGYMGGGYTAFTSRGIELDQRPSLTNYNSDAPHKSPDSDIDK